MKNFPCQYLIYFKLQSLLLKFEEGVILTNIKYHFIKNSFFNIRNEKICFIYTFYLSDSHVFQKIRYLILIPDPQHKNPDFYKPTNFKVSYFSATQCCESSLFKFLWSFWKTNFRIVTSYMHCKFAST